MMRMKYLTPLLFCLASILAFWACSKTDQTPTNEPENVLNQLIVEAKSYFEKDVQLSSNDMNNRKTSDGPKNIKKAPKWQGAYIRDISIGKAVTVPLAFNDSISVRHNGTQANVPISRYSYLLIYRDKAQQMHNEVVFVIPDTAYLRNSKDFTGTIIIRDWQGAFIKGYRYDDGKVISNIKTVGLIKKGDGSLYRPAPYECGLEDWYTCVSTDGGSSFYCHYEYTEPIICFGDDGSGGGSGGGGGGTPGGGDYPPASGGGGGGGGGSAPNITVNEILDNLTRPCFKTVLHDVNNGNLQNQVSKILCEMFDVTDKLNIRFYEEALADTIDGDTKVTPVATGGVGSLNMDVTLNIKLIDKFNSSKEYIAATILHEIIHAYFRAKGTNPLLDHNDMGFFYINTMGAGLKEIYPSLSDYDAKALAWGGVQESYEWSELVRNNPTYANTIINKNNNYRSGTSGIKCD